MTNDLVNSIPHISSYLNPLIQALKNLGGSGTVEEINSQVIKIMGFTDAQLEVLHNPEKGRTTKIEYRLGWARTRLKNYGVLENSSRGIWSLTPKGQKIDSVDPKFVRQFVRNLNKESGLIPVEEGEDAEVQAEMSWRDELLTTLLKMNPAGFERLVQRILRESGFIQVEVTGRSGDGGVDGKGIMRLGGLLSFHVIFQCKRYQGAVSASQVRDFRGAMMGRADKGLLITTGNFTKDAMREATRDGAPAIDLIDGELLMDKLKELGLGVQTKKIELEQVIIDESWFAGI